MLSLVAVVAAWLKGGHPERMGAVITLGAYVASLYTHPWRIGGWFAGDAALDLAVAVAFFWLAARSDRWWVLVMAAVMALTLLVHVAALLVPDMGWEANISARIGLGILSALTLLAGPCERWLAGEPAVSTRLSWRSRAHLNI